jgi:hypothetical protein
MNATDKPGDDHKSPAQETADQDTATRGQLEKKLGYRDRVTGAGNLRRMSVASVIVRRLITIMPQMDVAGTAVSPRRIGRAVVIIHTGWRYPPLSAGEEM